MREKLPAESNWDYAMCIARGIDKDVLIHDLLKHIERMGEKSRTTKGLPFWSIVGAATSHGSTVSSAIVAIYFPEAKNR